MKAPPFKIEVEVLNLPPGGGIQEAEFPYPYGPNPIPEKNVLVGGELLEGRARRGWRFDPDVLAAKIQRAREMFGDAGDDA